MNSVSNTIAITSIRDTSRAGKFAPHACWHDAEAPRPRPTRTRRCGRQAEPAPRPLDGMGSSGTCPQGRSGGTTRRARRQGEHRTRRPVQKERSRARSRTSLITCRPCEQDLLTCVTECNCSPYCQGKGCSAWLGDEATLIARFIAWPHFVGQG